MCQGPNEPIQRRVSFGEIHVREFNRILGDNPTVEVGPPVSIGWAYVQNEPVNLDNYEETRPPKKLSLRLVSFERRKILSLFEVPEKEVKAMVKKIKKQREAFMKDKVDDSVSDKVSDKRWKKALKKQLQEEKEGNSKSRVSESSPEDPKTSTKRRTLWGLMRTHPDK